MITIIDYGRGNLFSIEQGLRHLGAEYCVSGNVEDVLSADRIILPGVGAFGDAMETLATSGLADAIREKACSGAPILGICLGMQLLFEHSEEFGENIGLGILEGSVGALNSGEMRVPNVGWRTLVPNPNNSFLADISPLTMVYFVHSFVARPQDISIVAATIPFNGEEAAIAVASNEIMGFQFHPEKSGPVGLLLLKRFLDRVA